MPLTSLPYEAQLLICCANNHNDSSAYATLNSLLAQMLDWSCVLDLAERHGLVPMVAKKLTNLETNYVAPNLQSDLETRHRVHTYKSIHLATELRSLLQLFSDHGILAVPLKGPLLADQLYGDLSLRPSVDLDILVRRKDLPIAQQLVEKCGYLELSKDSVTKLMTTNYQLAFYREHDAAALELHWDVTSPKFRVRLDVADFWRNTKATIFLGQTVRSLSNEDLLLFLCVHAARHLWSRLLWLCDIATLVDTQTLDWDTIIARAERFECEYILALSLMTANKLWQTTLPPSIYSRWKVNFVTEQLTEKIVLRLFTNTNTIINLFDVYVLTLGMQKGFKNKAYSAVRLSRELVSRIDKLGKGFKT